jgi:sialate O-acetylesterase
MLIDRRAPIAIRFAAVAVALATTFQFARAQEAAVAEPESATLTVASIFSDHMVLQRDMPIPVWGKAEAGAQVTVTLGENSEETTADDDGHWRVDLSSHEAGGPHEVTVRAGDDETTFTDVLIGDVWVASGQSNMEWPVTASNDPEAEVAAADWPEIRIIDVPNVTAEDPVDAFQSAGWTAVTPQTIGGFSAVAYFFGRDLHKELNVPIGLIGCNWGGTQMEAWTSKEALETSPTFAARVEADEKIPDDEKAREERARNPHIASALFNGMLSAVIPYGIRGAIWYQGESNAGRHAEYAELSKLMIADWRNRWGQGDFPFLLVQLAAWEPGGETWPFLRESQADTLEAQNVGMAVATDIGDRSDIHPKNKQEVGRRLALAARALAYGQDIEYSGPVFSEIKIEDGTARLSFEHLGGGLKAEGEVKGFEIAGADGKFAPAKAEIDGAQVVVSSDDVAEPTQVRYNWAAYPEGNLFNTDGLPAPPFRTKR